MVLQEHGVNVKGINAEKVREKSNVHSDLAHKKTTSGTS